MTQAHKSHPISIERNPNRVRVHFNGRVVADTRSALTLREASLAPVLYIPRADANMTLLERTSHRTHCPFKSDANYYSLKVDGRTAENAVWTYEDLTPPKRQPNEYRAVQGDLQGGLRTRTEPIGKGITPETPLEIS